MATDADVAAVSFLHLLLPPTACHNDPMNPQKLPTLGKDETLGGNYICQKDALAPRGIIVVWELCQ